MNAKYYKTFTHYQPCRFCRWAVCASEDAMSKSEVTRAISDILRNMKFPPNLKGYRYVRAAIFCRAEDENPTHRSMKELYKVVADMYDTTPIRVERAIRNAIEVAWNRGGEQSICDFMGSTYKPANSEFIAHAAEWVKVEFSLW